MPRLLRNLLIVLLVLTVPVQACAVSLMALAPGGHAHAPALGGMRAAMHDMPAHHHAMPADAHASHAVGQGTVSSSTAHTGAGCAACCFGWFAPAALAAPAIAPLPPAYGTASFPPWRGVVAGRLERPPRV